MDTRSKQKRLGPAPIASFEKSFEDPSPLTVASIAAQNEIADGGSNNGGIDYGEDVGRLDVNQEHLGDSERRNDGTTRGPNECGQWHVEEILHVRTQQQQTNNSNNNTVDDDNNNDNSVINKFNIFPNNDGIDCKKQDQMLVRNQNSVNKLGTAKNANEEEGMDINDGGTTCKKSITTKQTAMATSIKMTTTAAAGADAPQTTTTAKGGGGGSGRQDNGNRTTVSTKIPPAPPTRSATTTTTTKTSSSNSTATNTLNPTTPRIELSRASSSSHHEEDSRDSSPENVFEQVGTGTLQESLDMGFREEGALELRSSTEELYFMDPQHKKEEEAKLQQLLQQAKRSSPHMFKLEDHQQTYLQQHQRKDSASSEVAALLCISGRTSRISSVGSQGSAVSRLSAVSGVSRSPSPHRMLLETSFCGPKPVETVIGVSIGSVADHPATALLEQVLLARNQDTTQAILAEGIQLESSPKRRPPTSLTNGDAKLTAKIKAQNQPETRDVNEISVMGAQRASTKSPGQMIVGKTPSGTEYIRINLKPDHMYDDQGIAPHEKIVDAPDSLVPPYARSQTKPASLCLTQKSKGDNLLTPTVSPKPSRKSKDHGSRSPSPATVSVSRKSSFSSLFRFGGGGGKDSPDSPRDRARPRSKSKERGQTPQSQNPTPNKQKSVLAIFKPGKRGSSAGAESTRASKSSSPVDSHEMQQLQPRSKSQTPVVSASGSRPNSRLRYYDDPVDGYIHIPLHTPPEEKEARKIFQNIESLNKPAPVMAEPPIKPPPQATAITMSDLQAAVKNLKPVGARKNSITGAHQNRQIQPKQQHRTPAAPLKHIENLDAIHSLSQDDENKERNWSLEVNRHSSQDSQETVGSGESYASAIRVVTTQKPQLAEVKEHVVQENGVEAEIHRLPSVESTTSAAEVRVVETKATINSAGMLEGDANTKERRKILFTTRLGSGSQDQVFATQFSISKTDSVSSHMSENTQDTLSAESTNDNLRRQNTVIKKSREEVSDAAVPLSRKESFTMERKDSLKMSRKDSFKMERPSEPPRTVERKESFKLERKESFKKSPQAIAQIEEQREIIKKSETRDSLKKQDSHERFMATRKKSVSTSEDEAKRRSSSSTGPPVVLRRKPSAGEEFAKAHQSRSTSEDDNEVAMANHRHSRYLESFDVRKKYHENVQGPPVPRKPRRQSGGGGPDANPPETSTIQTSQEQTKEQYQRKPQPQLPQPPPPSTDPTPLPSPSLREMENATPTPSGQQKSEPRSQSQSPVDKARQTPPKPPRTSTPTRRSQAASPTKTSSSSVPTSSAAAVSQVGSGTPIKKPYSHIDRQSVHSTDEPVESSESERDSDLAAAELKRRHLSLNVGCIEDHESTGLVSQESFDDELPYIPTNLPEEKAQPVSLIPMKDRANMELKTCPVERPRSTTPLNPSHLEEYCGIVNTPDAMHDFPGSAPVRGEKLRISLPRKDSKKDIQSSKSPRRVSNASGKSWFEFAEEGLRATTAHLERRDSNKQLMQQKPPTTVAAREPTQPPTKPKQEVTKPKTPTTKPRTPTQRKLSGHWIDFENIPEKRKAPKKITTLPRDSSSVKASNTTSSTLTQSRSTTHGKSLAAAGDAAFKTQQAFEVPKTQTSDAVVAANAAASPGSRSTVTTDGAGTPHYDYVKPEDCQCECHESGKGKEMSTTTTTGCAESGVASSTCAGKVGNTAAASGKPQQQQGVDLLQQGADDMLPLLSQDSHDGIEPSDSSREFSCYTDDEMDLPTRSSSRSKSSSSKVDEFPRRDVPAHNVRHKKFPDK
ncbi:serine/arginine repetitive matrix protein 2 [Musca vetustissima]|uniref:serine/arginine repetitive matrix protein 2 n=1 Tax=Musca vetustissima TaxID=27455 RepID=UPI002AB6F34B|nr:serine/arginine repetitive matrix protein 2 [Musca vetustissima]